MTQNKSDLASKLAKAEQVLSQLKSELATTNERLKAITTHVNNQSNTVNKLHQEIKDASAEGYGVGKYRNRGKITQLQETTLPQATRDLTILQNGKATIEGKKKELEAKINDFERILPGLKKTHEEQQKRQQELLEQQRAQTQERKNALTTGANQYGKTPSQPPPSRSKVPPNSTKPYSNDPRAGFYIPGSAEMKGKVTQMREEEKLRKEEAAKETDKTSKITPPNP